MQTNRNIGSSGSSNCMKRLESTSGNGQDNELYFTHARQLDIRKVGIFTKWVHRTSQHCNHKINPLQEHVVKNRQGKGHRIVIVMMQPNLKKGASAEQVQMVITAVNF